MNQNIRILANYDRVRNYLAEVTAAADSHRSELGFIPRGAYEDQAQQNKLWVAVDSDEYCGHLLFGGTYPNLRIFQIFVSPYRCNQGIAHRLIQELQTFATAKAYLSISAHVASDLSGANDFWSAKGFRAVIQQQGGLRRAGKLLFENSSFQETRFSPSNTKVAPPTNCPRHIFLD